MAELILGSVVDSITGQLVSLASREIGLARGVRTELKKLQDTVSSIAALLREAEKRQIDAEDVKDWLKKLNDVVYEADDLLDDFSTEALCRRRVTGRGKRILNEVRIFVSCTNQLVFASKMAHRVIEIRERIDSISDDKVRFHLEGNSNFESLGQNRGKPETYPYEPETYVIGRDKDKQEIINFLLSPDFEEDVSILPIVGFGGLGKTTLARLVFNDERVKEYFQLKLWVCVSTNFDVEDILRRIVPEEHDGKLTIVDELQKKLRELLEGKLFLLVLDDVWNENQREWLKLQGYLNIGARGSKILVTTRNPLVAKTMSDTSHQLGGLLEDESLSLLMRMARKHEQEWKCQNLEVIAKEILKKCAGVPLAITTIGRLLLFSRNTEEDWLKFRNFDLSRVNGVEGDIMPSLKLSYDFLPSHLKQCFAYCSLFPKDYELEPRELINLWMAQGFIKAPSNKQTIEEVGQEYFMELLLRSFFQDVEEDLYGNIVRCKLHDLMHDLAQSVAGNDCSTIDCSNVKKYAQGARHVSILATDDYDWSVFERDGRVRSLLFVAEETKWFGIGNLDASCFANLRALRIRGTSAEKISNSIGKLKHLRSLDLSRNHELRYLPDSISRLCNLETLNLRGCKYLKRLPRGITKLVNLRELDVSGCDLLNYMPKGMRELSNLQMLSMFMVGKKGIRSAAMMKELSSLTGLRKELTITSLDRASKDADATFSIISMEKSALQSLQLEWWSYTDDEAVAVNDEKLLERFRPNPDLKGLIILRYSGLRFPSWVGQLHKVVKIEITLCCNCRRLPPLDHLPFLKRISLLNLQGLECIELSDSSAAPQFNNLFPSLENIDLMYLRKFKGWQRRREGGNKIGEEEEDDDSMLFFKFSDKVIKVSIKDCPLFSYSHGEQKHLVLTTNRLLQQLLRKNGTVGRDVRSMAMALEAPTPCTIPMSSVPLSTITSLTISDMEAAEHLPAKLFYCLPSLQSLEFSNCHCLKALPVKAILRHLPALETLEISRCKELDLSIEDDNEDDGGEDGMHDLQVEGQCKLRRITIREIHKMECLPGWFQYLSSLQHLAIWNCDGLKSLLPGRLILRLLTTLESLEINECPELDFSAGESEDREGMPDWQFQEPAALRKLELWRLEKINTLPWWTRHLTNLEILDIHTCKNLEAFPGWFPNLTSLQILRVENCGEELTRRFLKDSGDDWPQISHIRTVILYPYHRRWHSLESCV